MTMAVIGLTAFNKIDPKDFVMLASMAFAFYFSNKGNPDEPYAGK